MTESNGSGRLSVCATSLRGQRRQNYGSRRVWCQLREGGTKGILSQHHTATPGKRPMCGSVATDRDGTGLGQPGPTSGAGQSPAWPPVAWPWYAEFQFPLPSKTQS